MPITPKWKYQICPTSHAWNGDIAILVTIVKRSGHTSYIGREIDFNALGIQRGGLLEKCIEAALCPVHASNATTFISTIKQISKIQDVRKVLEARQNILKPSDIHYLYREIDKHFEQKRIKTCAAQADIVRRMITASKYNLADGTLITQVAYTTSLELPTRTTHDSLSSKYDPNFHDPELAHPISAIGHADPIKQDAIIEQHYEARTARLISCCVKVFDDYEHLAEKIRQSKRQGLPESLQQRTKQLLLKEGRCDNKVLERRNAGDRLRINAFLVEFHKLYKVAPTANLLLLTGIPQLTVLAPAKSARLLFTALLSDYYLPKTAIIACIIIMLIETHWNIGVLLSLSSDRIRATSHGYEIIGIKTKTDQLQSREIQDVDVKNSSSFSYFIENTPAVRALRLLLQHNANIEMHSTRLHNSVFCTLNARYSGPLVFNLSIYAYHIRDFCKENGHPEFKAGEIRNHVAQHAYIKSGRDLRIPQASLGHKSQTSTTEYINSSIDYLTNEANIKRYMDLLGASILYISERLSISDKDESPNTTLIRTMLWPPSRFSDENIKFRLDQWLESGGSMQLTIGVDEVQHCAYQKKYYAENLPLLIEANPKKFQLYELPRILICYALYKLIEASPFRLELKTCEEALNA